MTIAVEVTKTTVPEILKNIERGDEMQLLRNGQAIARIVPSPTASIRVTAEQRERAQQALRDMDALSRELELGPSDFEEFKADRDMGRR